MKLYTTKNSFRENRLQNARKIQSQVIYVRAHENDMSVTYRLKIPSQRLVTCGGGFRNALLIHSKRKSIWPLVFFLGELEIVFIREIYFPPTPVGLQIFQLYLNIVSGNGCPEGELLPSG